MSRIKTPLCCLIAMLVTGALAPGLASAAPQEKYFVNKVALAAAEKVDNQVSNVVLRSEIGNVKILIECTKTSYKAAEIEPAGASKGEFALENCTLYEIAGGVRTSFSTKCKVEPIPVFKVVDELKFAANAGVIADLFKPNVGATFVEIEIKKIGAEVCPYGAAGGTKYKLSGEDAATFGPGGEVENIAQTLIFSAGGTLLRFGTNANAALNPVAILDFTISKIELNGGNLGKGWYVE